MKILTILKKVELIEKAKGEEFMDFLQVRYLYNFKNQRKHTLQNTTHISRSQTEETLRE